MPDIISAIIVFTSKIFIFLFLLLLFIVAIVSILRSGKNDKNHKLKIKNLSQYWQEQRLALLAETLPKKELKSFCKAQKQAEKQNAEITKPNLYVLNFNGDMKASAVTALAHEINAVLQLATPQDEVLVRLESPGGVVHGYGLAAAQLMRIRDKGIPLTITVDKVAASGGYMMACIANKIIAAPFAILGSIGVVVQLPNFNRALKANNIDFEMHTAGEFKRTVTLFGENTEEGRSKLKAEIETIHQQFKNLIHTYRPQLDLATVATGEHWLGQDARDLGLVDEIGTSDQYLIDKNHSHNVFEITQESKKPLLQKLFAAAATRLQSMLAK